MLPVFLSVYNLLSTSEISKYVMVFSNVRILHIRACQPNIKKPQYIQKKCYTIHLHSKVLILETFVYVSPNVDDIGLFNPLIIVKYLITG